jgi:hypothetical protein
MLNVGGQATFCNFLVKLHLSIKNNWSIREILLQRLVSGRLILHLTITTPSPMFPSSKKFFFIFKILLITRLKMRPSDFQRVFLGSHTNGWLTPTCVHWHRHYKRNDMALDYLAVALVSGIPQMERFRVQNDTEPTICRFGSHLQCCMGTEHT